MRRNPQALLETAIRPPTGAGAGAIATETPAAASRGARWVGLGLALAAALVALLVPAAAKALPNGYAYEKVTPDYKGNGEIGGTGLRGGFRGSESGDQVMYSADSVFLGAPIFPQVNVFFAHRGSDKWLNSSIGADLPVFPDNALSPFPPKYPEPGNLLPTGLSTDGTKTISGTNKDPQTGEPMQARPYIIDLMTGEIQRLTPEPIDPEEEVKIAPSTSAFTIGNDNYSTIMFGSNNYLTEDSLSLGKNDTKLYRYESGTVSLASWNPNGDAAPGILPSAADDPSPPNDLSADTEVFWFYDSRGSRPEIFRGEAGIESSALVSESENTEEEEVSAADQKFYGASTDGERAVFSSANPLVNEAPAGDNAYLYISSPDPENENNLTLISEDNEPADDEEGASGISDVLGVSDDAETVYFTTNSQQLVEGGPLTEGQKLYRWHDGDLSYLATAEEGEFEQRDEDPFYPPLATPDGRYQTFISAASGITADDNGGFQQLYIYDANEDQITCASCVPGGVNTGAISMEPFLNIAPLTNQPRRWLSDDGRAFFQSEDRLVEDDTNGSLDVYTWKDGKVDLISSGRNSVAPRFVDASADGSTVFFLSQEQLTEWDTDQKLDIYAARLNGGLPQPDFRPDASCEGEECQGQPETAPQATSIGSRDVRVPPRASARCDLIARRAVRVNRVARRTAVRTLRVQRLARRADGRVKRRLAVRTRNLRKRTQQLRKRSVQLKRRAGACRSQSR